MKVEHFLKPRGYRPGFIGVVDPVRGEVWVLSQQTIFQGISESTGKVLATSFLTGAGAIGISGLAADPKTGTIFVAANAFGGTRIWLAAIDEASGTLTVFRKFSGRSSGLVLNPAGGKIWVLRFNTLHAFGATGQHKPSGTIAFSQSRVGVMTEDPSPTSRSRRPAP